MSADDPESRSRSRPSNFRRTTSLDPTHLTTRQACATIDEDEAHALTRTAHRTPRPALTPTSHTTGRPYVEQAECCFTSPGRGAECADRADREAYAGRHYKSAYAHIVCLPDFVAPGDRTTAYSILHRIEAAIVKGGWTANEWNRLHAMQRMWSARYHGTDLVFNLRGWRKKGTGHHTPSVEKVLNSIRKEMGTLQCGFTTSDRVR